VNLMAPNPEKARVSIGTRLLSNGSKDVFRLINVPSNFRHVRPRERKKRKKGGQRKFVDLTNVITPAKFGCEIFVGFFQAEKWKKAFPFRKQPANITVPLACDSLEPVNRC